MKTFVYFILSHTNVAQVVRLVRRLRESAPACIVLIHHDRTASEPFDRAAFVDDRNVHVMERSIHGEWAHFSLVEIVLAGIADLAARGVAYDWLVLLSGQDYPVRPLAAFEAAVAASGDGLLAVDEAPGHLLDRYRFAWYRFPRSLEFGVLHRLIGFLTICNERQPYVRFLSGRVGCRVAWRPRSSPLEPGATFRKGTQWWALSSRAIAYVNAFVDAHPAFVRHYREHTIMPDESFFHTILLNESSLRFTNDDGRYTKWGPPGTASPEILLFADLATIIASKKFFARKFDARIDERIIDAVDALATGHV